MRLMIQHLTLQLVLLLCFIPLFATTSELANATTSLPLSSTSPNISSLIEQSGMTFSLLGRIFARHSYYGSWFSNSSIFNFFDLGEGYTVVESIKSSQYTPQASYHSASVNKLRALGKCPQAASLNLEDERISTVVTNTQDSWALRFRIYDGQYIDKKSFYVLLRMNYSSNLHFDAENATISATDYYTEIYLKNSGADVVLHQQCKTKFSLYLIDPYTKTPSKTPTDTKAEILIQYKIQSSECNFDMISAPLDKHSFVSTNQMNIYASLLSLMGLIKIFCFQKLKATFKRRAHAYGVSLGSLWYMSTLDYYLLILNIVLIFTYSFIVIVPSTVYVILTFGQERKTILQCLFSRRSATTNTLTDQEYRSCGFYFVALALLFVFELIFILTFRIWIMHISAFVFLPQIIHNFKRNKTYVPNILCIIPLGLIRLAFVFYVKYYVNNVFRLTPDTLFVTIYSSIMLIQVVLLLIQLKHPRLCFPDRKRKQSRLLYEDDVCSICIGHLTYVSADGDGNGPIRPCLATVETICGHVFHIACLRKWVKTKAECPICRANIEETACDIESDVDSTLNG